MVIMAGELLINKLFSERNTCQILVYLHLFGPKTRTEIYHAISTNPRMPIKIEMMENMGLLKTMDDGRGRKMVSLTSTGVKFATELCSLEKLIGGNVDGFKWGIVMTKLEEFDGAEA